MRIANFRDDVLWAIAYKLGLDPASEFLTDEGESLTSYINAWVRRTWDDRDWPEWTSTLEFTPDSRHIVAYHSVPVGASLPVYLSRPLKVYLVDPLATPYPIDTPHRLTDEGLHIGWEHGSSVWIKFLPLAPRFTSIKWDANRTYGKGDSAYSPDEGNCFISRVNNNKNNNPSIGYTQALPSDITQEVEPPNPGLPGQTQIRDAYVIPYLASTNGPPPIPPPPPVATTFKMTVKAGPDTNGGATILADVSYLVVAGDGYPQIISGIASALAAAPGMAGFTITQDSAGPKLRLEHGSDFRITTWQQELPTAGPVPIIKYNKQVQVRIYIAPVPPTPGIPQITLITIGPSQAMGCATYQLTFNDLEGGVHTVEYESLAGDSAAQIVAGLVAAIDGSPDAFFETIAVSIIDATLGTIEIRSMGGISIDATVTPESSAYWEKILFPYALVEPVVRGAYSDALREDGQTDKGMAEEQGAVQEDGANANKAIAPAYDSLTDQQRPAPRYRTRPAPLTATGR